MCVHIGLQIHGNLEMSFRLPSPELLSTTERPDFKEGPLLGIYTGGYATCTYCTVILARVSGPGIQAEARDVLG